MEMDMKIFNWAPVMMIIVGISTITYWFLYGKYNKIEFDDKLWSNLSIKFNKNFYKTLKLESLDYF